MIVRHDFDIDGRAVYFVQRFLWAFENWKPELIALYDDTSEKEIAHIYSNYPKK